jgi:predicted nuclease with RNAse H fold
MRSLQKNNYSFSARMNNAIDGNQMTPITIGIDVQANRACPYAVLDESARMVDGGWIATEVLEKTVLELSTQHKTAVFAIDAPRMALPKPRNWYWRKGAWAQRAEGEKGNGRHCEIVIAAHRLANPQWTPLASAAPEWMLNGFRIFAALEIRAQCLEVFPTASYKMFSDAKDMRVEVDLTKYGAGPKDMLDAVVAARTAMEFIQGHGQEVGGGDGYGSIVLPRKISSPIAAVMQWPES